MSRKLLNRKVIGILTAILVLFMAAGVAEEERTDAGGQWKYILEDGCATVTGCVKEPSGDLVIPGELDGYPVTGVGDKAFADCWGLTGVTIPASVARIGNMAFMGCVYLTDITIPEGVTGVGNYAFADCRALVSVTIPASVTDIRANPFAPAPFEGSSLENVYVSPLVKKDPAAKYAYLLVAQRFSE